MADPRWPDAEHRRLIGRRISRVDGPVKVTGRARYTYDINLPGMLHAKILRCPHAHARIRKVDVTRARSMPGVRAVQVIQGEGAEIQWALDEVAAVAADTEEQARDARDAILVDYEVLPHFVNDADRDGAPEQEPGSEETEGDPDGALRTAAARAGGTYGIASIAHCCLESHGQVSTWTEGEQLVAYCSTQAVTAMPGQLAQALDLPASKVRVITEFMGGGFGSKFSPDRWGVVCARLARETGRPVKLMLERDEELTVAGDRPSDYATVQVGADAQGRLVAWTSESWGSGGRSGGPSPPLPYVFNRIPNRLHRHTSIRTHAASSRAWRAPNHPQACFITMAALEDLAAVMGMDPLEFFRRNLDRVFSERLAPVYREELDIAAGLMDWKAKWHPRGESGPGPVKRGLGLSLHTWGGRAHRSTCELVIFPDGAVEARLGSQDLGTGTRTIIGLVAAETLGLPLEAVTVKIGDSQYPPSGPSGGSTTVGGVSSATRRAAVAALDALFEKAAPVLGAGKDELEAAGGRIRKKGDPDTSLSFRRAASLLGSGPSSFTGSNPGPGKLNDSGVGGVQMAEVAVDVETGVVRIEKMVAVQDCGLVLDLKTAESQVYGAMIMGISYALTEEKILDPVTGRMLNADMEFYKLPGAIDVGELVVHMMTGPGYDDRGVIGLGEPPVISPGAAIANAVANAVGVRVPTLPLTPDRVLDALSGRS